MTEDGSNVLPFSRRDDKVRCKLCRQRYRLDQLVPDPDSVDGRFMVCTECADSMRVIAAIEREP